MVIKLKNSIKLLISILIPLFVGFLSGILSGDFSTYQNLNRPSFAPPGFIFGIVWLILFILMGISSYLVYISEDKNRNRALIIYAIQLFLNFFWSIIFFRFDAYLLAIFWLIALIIAIVVMTIEFFRINKTSAYLQIPYLLWTIFALILTISVYQLN